MKAKKKQGTRASATNLYGRSRKNTARERERCCVVSVDYEIG